MIPGTEQEFSAGGEIGSFKIIANAGRGAYGEVLIVQDISGREYAMKIINAMKEELSALRAISELKNADGLVPVHAAGMIPDGSGRLYYLMDAADNLAVPPNYLPDTLANRIARNGRFRGAEILEVAARLLEGLKKLHGNNLSHRDIKPENIIFRQDQPMLADFGLLARSDDGSVTPSGTDGFFPPEELSAPLNGASSPKNDLFAIGKVIYCAWTGRSVLDYPQFHENPDLKELRIIRSLYAKACSEKPAERFHSCDEFSAAVRRAGQQLSASQKPAVRRNRWIISLVSCLVAALAIAGAFWRGSNDEMPVSEPEPVSESEPVSEPETEKKPEPDPDMDLLNAINISDSLRKKMKMRLTYHEYYLAWYNEIIAIREFCNKSSPALSELAQLERHLSAIVRGNGTLLCWRRCRNFEDHQTKLEELVSSYDYLPDDPPREESAEIRRLRSSVFRPIPEVTTLEEARKYQVMTPDLQQLVHFRMVRTRYYRAWLMEAKSLLTFCEKKYPDDPAVPKIKNMIASLQIIVDADACLRTNLPVKERRKAILDFIVEHGYPIEDPPAKEDDPDYVACRARFINDIK